MNEWKYSLWKCRSHSLHLPSVDEANLEPVQSPAPLITCAGEIEPTAAAHIWWINILIHCWNVLCIHTVNKSEGPQSSLEHVRLSSWMFKVSAHVQIQIWGIRLGLDVLKDVNSMENVFHFTDSSRMCLDTFIHLAIVHFLLFCLNLFVWVCLFLPLCL